MTPTAHQRSYLAAAAIALMLAFPACVIAEAAEGTFERTLTVTGSPDVEITTGSGRIEVRAGADGRVEVSARIRAHEGWTSGTLSAEERIRRIQNDPPIQQSGKLIRIGHIQDEDVRKGLSISYTVTVPASTSLTSKSGSGSQAIEGLNGSITAQSGSGSVRLSRLGGEARASSGSGSIEADGIVGAFHASAGSGSIHATGVKGAITAKTGSGSIDVTQTGAGEVEASSGSGRVRLQGVRGGVRATTGSGGIDVQGALTGDWRLSAGSGSIRIDLPPGQGFELDATTGSGGIDLAAPITVTGTVDRRRLRGTVGQGGPLLQVRTSSGGVQIRQ